MTVEGVCAASSFPQIHLASVLDLTDMAAATRHHCIRLAACSCNASHRRLSTGSDRVPGQRYCARWRVTWGVLPRALHSAKHYAFHVPGGAPRYLRHGTVRKLCCRSSSMTSLAKCAPVFRLPPSWPLMASECQLAALICYLRWRGGSPSRFGGGSHTDRLLGSPCNRGTVAREVDASNAAPHCQSGFRSESTRAAVRSRDPPFSNHPKVYIVPN